MSCRVPLSWQPLFYRCRQARNMHELVGAVHALVPRLQRRGVAPDAIGHGLAELMQPAGLGDAVVPIVHNALIGRKGSA